MSESNIQDWIDRVLSQAGTLREEVFAVLDAKDKRIEAQKIVISELLAGAELLLTQYENNNITSQPIVILHSAVKRAKELL